MSRRWRIVLLIATALSLLFMLVAIVWPGAPDPEPPSTAPLSDTSAIVTIGNYAASLPEPQPPEKPDLPRRRGIEGSYIRAENALGDEVGQEYCHDELSCLLANYEIEVGKTVYITAVMWSGESKDEEGRRAGVAVQYPDGTQEQTVVSVAGDSRPVTVQFPFDTSKFVPEFLQEETGDVIRARYIVWGWLFDDEPLYRDKWRMLEFVAVAPPGSGANADRRIWAHPDPRMTLESWVTARR